MQAQAAWPMPSDGNPVSVQKAIGTLKTFHGVVEQASEDELANAAARADRTGLFNCPHTGVALAVLFKLVERGDIRPQDRVVVVSTANALKFPEFKIKYHQGQLADVSPRYSNRPIQSPSRLSVHPRRDSAQPRPTHHLERYAIALYGGRTPQSQHRTPNGQPL